MNFKQQILFALFALTILCLTSCDVLKQLQMAEQANSGTASVIAGDNTLPGAQKGGIVVDNKPYQANYKVSGIKYKDHVFENVKKTTEVYAKGAKEYNGKPKDLLMDIYMPSGDETSGRPCVIFLFGGGWFMKNIGGMDQFGKGFAMKGFVGVSIDYRIGFTNGTGMLKCKDNYSGFNEAWYRAAQDAKAAIRYVKANAERLGIDKNKIYIGGHSAGAFTALNAVQLDDSDVPQSISAKEGILNSIGSNQNENDQVAGEFILAGGAIGTLNYVDKDVSTYLLLGTCDEFIPNGAGTVYKCATNPTAYAGQPLFDKLKSNGACVHYDVSCGGDHGFGGMAWEQMVGLVSDFIYQDLKGNCKTGKDGVQANVSKCQVVDKSVCK